ncbi:RodZ domain-containing protein [Alkalinema pantanalense CENA528]|uniref:helix-turn-helix domain-containing protein n=1 Tax=Alkalinema pantanalense TaxID=1620705 RepID=UPI003D6F62A2
MDKFAAETLKAIAEKLIQARETQGISLNEVSAKTYIPLRILKALEAAETYKLPEPIFVQGFIKRYADLVGLDGTAISHEFPLAQTTSSIPNPVITQAQSVPVRPSEPLMKPPIQAPVPSTSRRESGRPSTSSFVTPNSSTPATDRANVAAPITEPIASRSTALQDLPSSWTRSPDRPTEQTHWRLPILGGILGVVLLGSIVVLLSHNLTPKATTEPSTPTNATTNSPSPASESQPITAKSTSSAPPAAPSSSPPAPQPGAITVSLNVTDESWVEVEVDGKVETSATLPKGTQKTWSGQKQIIVYSGNAKGVSVSRNQGAAKALGTTADPKGIKFTAAGESPL